MPRILPKIDIEGTVFRVDSQAMELRPVNDADKTVSLRELIARGKLNDHSVTCLFDRRKGIFSELPYDTIVLPKGTVRVVLPHPIVLDPVGVALRHGKAADAYTKVFPVKRLHKAEVLETVVRKMLKEPRNVSRGQQNKNFRKRF